MSLLAAWIYVVLIGVAILFQLGLTMGMPWGEYAMGGRYPGRFPLRMRIAAAIQSAVLAGLAVVVAVRGRMFEATWFDTSKDLMWVVIVIAVASVVLNLSTPSRWERRIWGPITIVMLICSVVVAVD